MQFIQINSGTVGAPLAQTVLGVLAQLQLLVTDVTHTTPSYAWFFTYLLTPRSTRVLDNDKILNRVGKNSIHPAY